MLCVGGGRACVRVCLFDCRSLIELGSVCRTHTPTGNGVRCCVACIQVSYFSLAGDAKGKRTDARPLATHQRVNHTTPQLSLAVMAVLPNEISKRCAVAGLERWCAFSCLLVARG